MFQQTNQLPEEQTWRIEDLNLQKRARFLQTSQDYLWNRWQRVYVTALRERHKLVHKTAKYQVTVGDVVLVPLAIVQQTYPGHDRHIRAVQLKTRKGVLECPVQLLYPLELQCELSAGARQQLNPDAPVFTPRPVQDAAVTARAQTQDLAENTFGLELD